MSPYIDADRFLGAVEAAAIKAGVKLFPNPTPISNRHKFRLWKKEKKSFAKSTAAQPTIIEQLVNSKSQNNDDVTLPLSYREACMMRVALQLIRLNIIMQTPQFKNKDTIEIMDKILAKLDNGIKSGGGDKK